MNDRELLEAAAKAAGLVVLRSRLDDPLWHDLLLDMRPAFPQTAGWNPLTDDGDAFRLAVALGISVNPGRKMTVCAKAAKDKSGWTHEFIGDDPYAATRRAIVRAAAALKDTA